METKEYKWPKGESLTYVRPPVEEYHGKLENFYSPELFPELQLLKDNWKAIRDEVLEFEKKNGELNEMSAKSPANAYGGNWTLIYLTSFLRKFHKNRKRFPITTKIIDQIPNLVLGAISVLPPNTEIAPHYGDTNGIVRSHLALIVPEPYPTIGIRVGDEEHGWEEGELICFINVQKHSVWNRSNKRRYVIMLDFVPDILSNRKMEICSKGLGSQSFIFLYNKFALFRSMPTYVHEFSCVIFSLIWRLYLPVQRRFEFLK